MRLVKMSVLEVLAIVAIYCTWSQAVVASQPTSVEARIFSDSQAENATLVIGVSANVYADIREGRPRGVIIEAADYIARQMGYSPTYLVISSKEMAKKVRSGEIAIGATSLIGVEGEAVSYSPAIIREYSVLVGKRTRSFDVKSIDALRGLKIGGRVGFKYPGIENEKGIDLIRNRKDGENIRGLFLGELDLAVVGSVSDIYEFYSEGVMSELVVLDNAIGYVDIGLSLSNVYFSRKKMAEFRLGIGELLKGAEWKNILERNGMAELVKEWPTVLR